LAFNRILIPVLVVALGQATIAPVARTLGEVAAPARPVDALMLTRDRCLDGRIQSLSADAIVLSVRGQKSPARVAAADLTALVIVERPRGNRAIRWLATIALGAGAIAALATGRPKSALALGLAAWWVPWWGHDERRVARLAFVAADADTSRPASQPDACEATVYGAMAAWRRSQK
jgi:hypothetical protein